MAPDVGDGDVQGVGADGASLPAGGEQGLLVTDLVVVIQQVRQDQGLGAGEPGRTQGLGRGRIGAQAEFPPVHIEAIVAELVGRDAACLRLILHINDSCRVAISALRAMACGEHVI